MAGQPLDMGKWKGIFDWSMKYQDGTRPTDYSSAEMTPEKREWLEKAMQEMMKDLGDRMKEIKTALDAGSGGAAAASDAKERAARSLAEEEALLDELVEIVESIDQARDLHKVGGLDTLLSLMRCPQPSLRWRAAEVAATCMANNPPVQRWFLDGGAAAPLMALLKDADATCRTKALLALSAMARHYDPGLEAFRLAGGLENLLDIIGSDSGEGSASAQQQQVEEAGGDGDDEETPEERSAAAAAAQRRLRRKALSLLQYVCAKHPADCLAAAKLGGVEALEAVLLDPAASSDCRHAALEGLFEIASHPDAWTVVKERAPQLPALLRQQLGRHEALPADDREAEDEEGDALRRLAVLLAAPAPPAGAKAARSDHIEVDPWHDGHDSKTVTLEVGKRTDGNNNQPQQQQQQQQQQLLTLGLPMPSHH